MNICIERFAAPDVDGVIRQRADYSFWIDASGQLLGIRLTTFVIWRRDSRRHAWRVHKKRDSLMERDSTTGRPEVPTDVEAAAKDQVTKAIVMQ